jgi:nitrogen regulatory protein PII
LEKTIDTILEAASTGMVGDGKYLFLTFKKPIESEPKKRNGCHQITNLNKKLIKNILWIRMLY